MCLVDNVHNKDNTELLTEW